MKDYKVELLSKNGRTSIMIAKEMLIYNEGDRIKTVGQYSEMFNTGRGTVQAAFKFLQEIKAIYLESRGHLGTYIMNIDYEKLWDISGIGVIMGVMPLPYSKRYEGLATGIYKTFETERMPFSLAFMRGATKRIEALKLGRYNFAVVSKLAAELEMRKFDDIEIIHEFHIGSYVGKHVVILRDDKKNQIEDGMRVAMDPTSTDQIVLTAYECEGKKVKYIEMSYNQIVQKLQNNEIDAAIWNVDEIEEKNIKFNICPLANPKTREVSQKDTIATIVINKDSKEIKEVIKKIIDMEKVEEIQQKVMNKEMIPSY